MATTGEVAYRQLVLRKGGEEKLRVPLAAPVNDMLGQIRPRGLPALYLSERYSGVVVGRAYGDRSVAQAFLAAARAATKGHVSGEIASHLERLRFAPDGGVADVPDFAALAAWSLLEAVRRQPLKLYTCPTCKGKWLGTADEASKYCQRTAPDQTTKDCRTLAYERRVAGDAAYNAYRREYRRITEAQRRRSLDVLKMVQWRAANGPTSWLPFDEWKATQEGGTDG
jgi:hypothetical protein